MSNIKFIFPDFFRAGTRLTPTSTTTAQVINGARNDRFEASAAATTSRTATDLGASVTRTPDVLAVLDAHFMILNDTTSQFVVKGSAASDFSTGTSDTITYDETDLVGPDSRDIVFAIAPATARRYWRVQAESTASFKHKYSKVFLGNALDLGRDPSAPLSITLTGEVGDRRERRMFSLKFEDITDANLQAFYDAIANYQSTPFLIWANSYPSILAGQTLLYVTLDGAPVQTVRSVNSNDLTIKFLEEL